jgi:3-deoxy-manno-octulosonate cytidylyltransferase (CMP-KDO synthetase)
MITSPTGEVLSICGVIPVRMESKRFPGKPLRSICGEAMIGWVYRGARRSAALDRLIVATDSELILNYCKQKDLPSALTLSVHTSGTDRLVEVMEQEAAARCLADIYVNIQGDEPMVTASHIELLLRGLQARPAAARLRSARDEAGSASAATMGADIAGTGDVMESQTGSVQVATLKVTISPEAAADPNAVKVVTDARGLALYFSRAPIPYNRDASGQTRYYKHLGFYAYTVEALRRFRTLEPSPLERSERLEQLRFLENGIPMAVVETDQDTIGVDTEADLRQVEDYFRASGVEIRSQESEVRSENGT